MKGLYARRGASSSKTELHEVVDKLDPGLFPGAFCKITEDVLGGDPSRCCVIHSDGSGTKSALAYVQWRETGDASVFRGIAQDSVVMNLDDLLCVGADEGILVSSTINRNAGRCPSEVIEALIEGTEEFIKRLRGLGVSIYSGGGETADVGDLTGTVVVDTCAAATLKRAGVIDASRIEPGLVIVGLSSSGKAAYETAENSGMGSNGFTSARHDLLSRSYGRKYPETFDPAMDKKLAYRGKFRLDDPLPGSKQTVGEALLSPTRTYAPILSRIFRRDRSAVKGLIHCSGGGQTKCLRFGKGLHYVKDNLFPPPPVFQAILKQSRASLKEMHRVFNMGHRMEIYCRPEDAPWMMVLSRSLGVDARVVGRVEKSILKDGRNHLTILAGKKTLEY